MDRLLHDIRYGLRMLARTPTASATVLIALALGIAVSALMFSLIDGAVLTSLPADGGERIMRITRTDPLSASPGDYTAWEQGQRSFEAIGAAEAATSTVAFDGWSPEPFGSAAMTPSVFRVLAVQPEIGRPFGPDDAVPGARPVVLVSHRLWQERLNGDRGALGQIVRVDGRPAEVIGVMPAGFGFPWDQDVWVPLAIGVERGADGEFVAVGERASVVGRLREGVSIGAASAELTAIAEQVDRSRPAGQDLDSNVNVRGYTDLFSRNGLSVILAGLMLGITLLVLLVACSNAANVLLARAVARRKEVAVRLAIGASRSRITRQFLTEISLLAIGGAAAGVFTAVFGLRWVKAVMPPGMPYWIDLSIDAPVLAFVVVVTGLAALMAGLMPALKASDGDVHGVLKDEARGTSGSRFGRMMRRLIGVQIALSFVLLVMAGLFIQSAANFSDTQFGFDPEGVYTAALRLPDNVGDSTARARLVTELTETLSGLPEVDQVALGTAMPGIGGSATETFEIEGTETGADVPRTRSITVSPGYFELFHSAIVAGRNFDSRDGPDAPAVAVVNLPFAARYFEDGAVDRRIRYTTGDGEQRWLQIVGVSQDLMAGGVERQLPEAVYLPVAQNPTAEVRVFARPNGTYESLVVPIREAVAGVEPDAALFGIQTHDRAIFLANSQYTWFSILFFVCGAIALFLAALGLYGVMAFWLIQRTREIGVRMALGGKRLDILRLVLRQGLAQTATGLLVGLVLALAAAQLLSSALFEIAPWDPVVFGSILLVLGGAGALGCWLPARRATRVNPVDALAAG